MKRYRLCFVQTQAYRFFSGTAAAGGAELQFYYLATTLARNTRYEVHFVLGDFGQPTSQRVDGVWLHRWENSRRSLIKLVSLWRVLNSIDADLYLTTSRSLLVPVTMFAKLFRKKNFHRTSHERQISPTLFPGSALSRAIHRSALRACSLCLTQSIEHQRLLQTGYGIRSVVLNNALPLVVIQPAKKESVLWMARAIDWKQPQLFLDLAQRFPEQTFVMVCPPSHDQRYWHKIKKRAATLSNVTFYSSVPYRDTWPLFAAASVFVNTSSQEGWPNTFLQAGATRTPILSLTVDPEGFIEQTSSGLVCHGSIDRLTAGLEHLLRDGDKRQQLGEHAFAYVTSFHSLPIIASELARHIDQALTTS